MTGSDGRYNKRAVFGGKFFILHLHPDVYLKRCFGILRISEPNKSSAHLNYRDTSRSRLSRRNDHDIEQKAAKSADDTHTFLIIIIVDTDPDDGFLLNSTGDGGRSRRKKEREFAVKRKY